VAALLQLCVTPRTTLKNAVRLVVARQYSIFKELIEGALR
jgi:hypothetical protein